MHIYIIYSKKIKFMENYIRHNFHPFSSRGDSAKNKIMERTKIGKYIGLIPVLMVILSTISTLPINSDRNGVLIIKMMVERGDLSRTTKFLHAIFFYYMQYHFIYTLSCFSNMLLYFLLHVHCQYVLLIEGCNSLEDNLENMEEVEDYHKTIEARLSSILRHYQVIIRLQILIDELYRKIIYFLLWLGLMMLMFMSYLLVEVDLGPDIICIFMVWLTTVQIALAFATYGQFYADQKSYLWDALINCHWLNWNVRNRRTYLMFLYHVNKGQFIKPGGLLILNWPLLIWFGRKTASAVAFVSAIEEINSH